nr:hypothetical protein [Tanacetum cinerariifolium]
MVKMVPHEAFACSCTEEDVVLRQSYKPKRCASETFWMWIFLWKETRLRQLMSSPGAPSAGPSTPPSYSSGLSTPPSYSSRPLTTPKYSPGSSRNAECSNCKLLRGKISEEDDSLGREIPADPAYYLEDDVNFEGGGNVTTEEKGEDEPRGSRLPQLGTRIS